MVYFPKVLSFKKWIWGKSIGVKIKAADQCWQVPGCLCVYRFVSLAGLDQMMHSHKSYYSCFFAKVREHVSLPRPSPLPVTSAANGQLLSGHSIPLHSIKFQTVPLISRKFHDILLKCTRKSASRSAFGQLPLERRMRIQRGKGKTTILPGYQTGLLHVQTSDKTHQMGIDFFCRTVSQGIMRDAVQYGLLPKSFKF